MDKVRRNVHPKSRPFNFQIKTYYLSDANYPTDNPFQCEYGHCVGQGKLPTDTSLKGLTIGLNNRYSAVTSLALRIAKCS